MTKFAYRSKIFQKISLHNLTQLYLKNESLKALNFWGRQGHEFAIFDKILCLDLLNALYIEVNFSPQYELAVSPDYSKSIKRIRRAVYSPFDSLRPSRAHWGGLLHRGPQLIKIGFPKNCLEYCQGVYIYEHRQF